MKTYIGIDLGGTNIRVAKITEDGKVLQQIKSPSYGAEGRERVLENLKKLVRQIDGWEECSGMGVGVPGPCDQKTGSMSMSTNLPGFTGYPFADDLSKEFGMPAYIENDANVAGLAEAVVGAGKGLSVVEYVTISTGIGGALIVDGKVVSGKHGYAGEIANIIIDRDRGTYNHLAPGAVENEASGTAITRKGRELLPEMNIRHAGQVFDLAAEGNEIAQKIADAAIADLAQLFATLAAVADPDIFVLGGGMMKSADKFLDKLIEKYKEITHTALHDTPFVIAQLEEPGIIGAAMVPRSHEG
ncbi:MAG: ROK family protein [Solobacterium sp.]|nr:ROK family protein [Solobacterium sp.]